MNLIEDHNRRMPLHWTAQTNVMSFQDHGACGFFHVLYVHLLYVATMGGQFSERDSAEIEAEANKLVTQRLVKLRVELQPQQIRLYSSDFGGFGKFNILIPYKGLIQNHLALKSLPPSDDSWAIELACRGCEVLINAIERKAPGLVPILLTSGLPKNFSFETWPQDDANMVPGQFLRILPSNHLEEILGWIQSETFKVQVQKLTESIESRWSGLEQRN